MISVFLRKHNAPDSFDVERYKNICIYAATLKSVLPTLELGEFRPDTYSLGDLLEMIGEYAVEETPSQPKKQGGSI